MACPLCGATLHNPTTCTSKLLNLKEDRQPILVLDGPSHVGKTTFYKQLCEKLDTGDIEMESDTNRSDASHRTTQ